MCKDYDEMAKDITCWSEEWHRMSKGPRQTNKARFILIEGN